MFKQEAPNLDGFEQAAYYYRDGCISAMDVLRAPCDKLEEIISTNGYNGYFELYGKVIWYLAEMNEEGYEICVQLWGIVQSL